MHDGVGFVFTFTAHVSLAPASTIAPIVVLDNGGPGYRCACPPVPTTRRPSFYFALATVNLVTTDVPHHFVAGKLLYGLRRRRSRCTFPHCMFSRNVYLPPASRPVHRRPLMFWPPTPVDLLLKVVAHHCCR